MICKLCGTESNSSNCPKCGMPMAIPQSRPQTPPSVPPAAPQYVQPQQQPVQPQAPQYAQPQQPVQPQAPQYAQPQQPVQPQAPQYAQPQQPVQPQAPQYAQPQQPVQPQAPQYAQPQQRPAQPQYPQYAQPQQRPAQPQYSQYAQPQQRPAQPQYPQYAQPQQRPVQSQYQPYGQPQQRPAQQQPPQYAYRPASKSPLPVVKREEPRQPQSPLRMKKVVWPALALLLPLFYLVFEAFAVLVGDFADGTLLATLFHNLTGGSFDDITVSEMAEAMAPEQSSFYELISLRGVLKGIADVGVSDMLPRLILIGTVVLFVLLSVVCSLLLLCSAGRLLRFSFFNGLLAFSGAGAVAAPLVGLVLLRLYYLVTEGLDAADTAMQGVTLTPEALLILLILFCTLRPALATLRRLSAKADGQEEYPLFPYRSAAKRSYGFLKTMAVITMACGLFLPLLYAFLPVTGEGSLVDLCKDLLADGELSRWSGDLSTALGALFGGEQSSVNIYGFLADLMTLGIVVMLAVLLCTVIHALVSLIRTAVMKEDTPAHNKNAKRLLRSLGTRVRNLVMGPYLCLVAFRALLIVLTLFCSPMLAHLDFANVEETLGAYYVTALYLNGAVGWSTAFTLLGLGGAVLWHATRQLGLSIVVRTGKKTKKF